MKRIVSLILIMASLFTLTGCDLARAYFENLEHNMEAKTDEAKNLPEFKVEKGENGAKLILDGFEGKHTVKLSCGDVTEGTMKLDISVTEGELDVYYDFGWIDETYLIASLKTGETLERGAYIPSVTSVLIIVYCASPTTATIDVSFYR